MKGNNRKLDDIMANMVGYCLTGAEIALNILYKSQKELLETELTKDQKEALKDNLGWIGGEMMYLRRAQQSWRTLNKSMEELNAKVADGMVATAYDSMMEDCNEVIGLMLLYMEKADTPEKVNDIHNFLLSYDGGTSMEIRKAYDKFIMKSRGL